MKKKFSLLALMVFMAFGAWAQSDSTTFANAQWKVKKIGKGITLKEYHFTGDTKIFDSNQYVSIIEIDTKKAKAYFPNIKNVSLVK